MKTIRNMTLGLAVALTSAVVFAGEPQHGLASGKRMHDPVTVAPPANGKGQAGIAVKGAGVPEHTTVARPATGNANGNGAGIDDKKNISDGAAKGQANE